MKPKTDVCLQLLRKL